MERYTIKLKLDNDIYRFNIRVPKFYELVISYRDEVIDIYIFVENIDGEHKMLPIYKNGIYFRSLNISTPSFIYMKIGIISSIEVRIYNKETMITDENFKDIHGSFSKEFKLND